MTAMAQKYLPPRPSRVPDWLISLGRYLKPYTKPLIFLGLGLLCLLIYAIPSIVVYIKSLRPEPKVQYVYVTPSPTPKKIATPTPEPKEKSSVKQVAENEWRVHLVSKEEWFDTGVPVIANGNMGVERATDSNDIAWLTKVGETGKVMFAPRPGQYGGPWHIGKGFCEPDTETDFRGTVWLRIDDESKLDSFDVIVSSTIHNCDPRYDNEDRKKFHAAAEKWYAMMRAKIERR